MNIRHRMVECLKELGAVSYVCVHYPTARRGQEQARARALTELLPHLLDDGTTELLIERRTQRGDARDRQTILRALQEMGAPGALRYDWRDKSERVLWLADAVCGVVREYLLQTPEAGYYDELKATGVVAEPIYLAPGQT